MTVVRADSTANMANWSRWTALQNTALADPDRAAAKRAFEAMMPMTKINVAEIEKAWRG